MPECTKCGHALRPYGTRVAQYPGTREQRTASGLCKVCEGGSAKQKPGTRTHCSVCSRRLRGWGVPAADDPTGVQRGDARRCVGCKYGNKEVLKVDELSEAEVAWVERNVPKDLHHYFGVTND